MKYGAIPMKNTYDKHQSTTLSVLIKLLKGRWIRRSSTYRAVIWLAVLSMVLLWVGRSQFNRSVKAFSPMTVSPLAYSEASILHASDGEVNDYFGMVSVSGDTLVVGAHGEDGGVGDPKPDAGVVYVFERHDGGTNNWGEVAILRASDAQEGDNFGWSVSISNDIIVVGAHLEDGGVGDSTSEAGAAYVYERHHGGTNNWGEVAILRASDAQENDNFGGAVSISGNTIIIGATVEDGGVGDSTSEAGAAYVYERHHGGTNNWGEVAILRASDAQAGDNFGSSVSINGDTLVVGAAFEAGGVGDPIPEAGAAYVYERHQGGTNNWGEVTILRASDAQAGDNFSAGDAALSLSNDTVVVGAWQEAGGTANLGLGTGAAYIFERHHGGTNNWGEVAILRASDAQAGDNFGGKVSLSNNTILVGATDEDGGAGDPKPNAGAAYVFGRHHGGTNNWGELTVLRANDAQAGDFFGASVGISGDTLIIGASSEDGGAGDPKPNAGAAYTFIPSRLTYLPLMARIPSADDLLVDFEEDGWAFSHMRSFYDENLEALFIFGRLTNKTGNAVEMDEITGHFLDDAGNIIAEIDDSDLGYYTLLPPDTYTPFWVSTSELQSLTGFELEVGVFPPEDVTVRDNFTPINENRLPDEDGNYCVTGQLQDEAGEQLGDISIIITLYDNNNKVINFDFPDLEDPEAGAVLTIEKICVDTFGVDVNRHEFQAWEEIYE